MVVFKTDLGPVCAWRDNFKKYPLSLCFKKIYLFITRVFIIYIRRSYFLNTLVIYFSVQIGCEIIISYSLHHTAFIFYVVLKFYNVY